MHELETTKWTLDRLEQATPDEIMHIRRIIAQKNTGPQKDYYNTFLTRLLRSVDTFRNEPNIRRRP
jgi:hypothetical protein